jgi:hypothetical protein
MTKQHIFIIENNIQKVGQSFFHLSDVSFHWYPTNVNVEACIVSICLHVDKSAYL